MTREDALPKLLAYAGPMPFDELYASCGWPAQELRALVAKLRVAGRVRWVHIGGQRLYCSGASDRVSGRRLCK